jgi:hypothetical protein
MNIKITIALDEHQHRQIMAAIDTLNSNITALTSVIALALPDINPTPGTGATEAQVAAAATAVATQTALLQAAITPPTVPAPAPTTP